MSPLSDPLFGHSGAQENVLRQCGRLCFTINTVDSSKAFEVACMVLAGSDAFIQRSCARAWAEVNGSSITRHQQLGLHRGNAGWHNIALYPGIA